MKDTISILSDSIHSQPQLIDQQSVFYNSVWLWVIAAVVVLLIIVVLLLLKAKRSTQHKIKQQVLKETNNINWSDTMHVFEAKKLYDQLKVKCHPDRFVEPDMNKLANELFQEITRNQNNYSKLLLLKKEAIDKLNINF